jgi:photosystem II stability/assembly factor-like uncharacterized protein
MKKSIFTLIFVLVTTYSHCQWTQQISNITENLNAVHFVNSQNGWAVGDNGTILYTDNGGETWIQMNYDTIINIEDIFFIDQERGWVAGNSDSCVILRTMNGGITWEEVYKQDSPHFNALFFTDTLHGWAIGTNYGMGPSFVCLNTLDGGLTWNYSINSGNYDMHFIDSVHGWSVGGITGGSNGYTYGFVCNTIDGGNSWAKQFEIEAPPAAGNVYLKSIYFSDLNNGWAVGDGSNILSTVDGGGYWDLITYQPESHFSSVCFADSLCGWVVGKTISTWNGIIINTTNGGDNWLEQYFELPNALNSIYCTDPQNAWIVGDSGIILHTNNGGVGINEVSSNHPEFTISPNPANQSTIITFEFEKVNNIIISIKNIRGQEINIIPIGQKKSGIYNLDCSDLSPGIYLISLKTNTGSFTQKLIIE